MTQFHVYMLVNTFSSPPPTNITVLVIILILDIAL